MVGEEHTVSFRSVPGFFNYEVSSDGHVWSYYRRNGRLGATRRKLRPSRARNGYPRVKLFPGRVQLYVHHLILEAFVGRCPPGMETRHLNGDRADNRLENLCWGTRTENAADTDRHGKRLRGERNGFASLT